MTEEEEVKLVNIEVDKKRLSVISDELEDKIGMNRQKLSRHGTEKDCSRKE